MVDCGYREVKEELISQYEEDRLSQTLLIHGPQGVGALPLAIDLAQHILSSAPKTADLFGQTTPSQSSWRLDHPDFHVSFPFINTKSGNKSTCDDYLVLWRKFIADFPYANDKDWLHALADEMKDNRKNPKGNINTAECQNILSKLSLKAFGNNPKVLIIWYPEYLGKEGNRLLKTMEEPTPDTFIFLIAENTQLILNTILSRCQNVLLTPWSDEEIEEGLKMKGVKLTEAKKQEILYRSGGDFRVASHLSEKSEDIQMEFVLEWFRKCYLKQSDDISKLCTTFTKYSQDDQIELLKSALHFVRQMHGVLSDPEYMPRIEESQALSVRKLARIMTLHSIEALKDILEEMIQEVRRNASSKIVFTDMSYQIHQVFRSGERPVYIHKLS